MFMDQSLIRQHSHTQRHCWFSFRLPQLSKYQNKEGHMSFFGFPAHLKAMFTLYCELLSGHYVLKKQRTYHTLEYFIAKKC